MGHSTAKLDGFPLASVTVPEYLNCGSLCSTVTMTLTGFGFFPQLDFWLLSFHVPERLGACAAAIPMMRAARANCFRTCMTLRDARELHRCRTAHAALVQSRTLRRVTGRRPVARR